VRWVDNQGSRWGSCTPIDATIRLSSRLRGMPTWVIDYVLVHELAHLLVPGHGPAFWAEVGRYPRSERARGYLEGVAAVAGLDLSGVRVLLDCANGATYRVAPEIFRRLGATVTVIADEPDGRNINDGVGSTHVDALAARIDGHDVGFAFDGDGDRVLAVDRTGAVVDGDELLALVALHRRVPGVAVTVMTNYGFHVAMERAEVAVETTKVGDRYVLEALRRTGWALGGEQSGHLIDMGFVPSGDGIAAALMTLEALGGGDLAERTAMEKLPQRLVNVRVADRDAAGANTDVAAAIEREAAGLEGRGRVLVRPSGTEQLIRVMAEAPTQDEADSACARIAAAVEAAGAAS